MTVILAFIAAIIAVAAWWLLREGVMTKPWLETGAPAPAPMAAPPGRTGLGVFLVVAGALFALFGSAFVMRMDLEFWSSFEMPGIVWTNTALLLAAGVFLHLAARAAGRGETGIMRRDMRVAGVATLGFLGGQLRAWHDLTAAGEGLAAGPAASFFYLLSGLHGLHILGGLAALGLIAAERAGPQDRAERLRLCATYWDFMLVVWLGLLILFLGWANGLVDICRSFLT
ncbi:MAG: cytochrome c oxidase subunit 3 [Pseudomonadota bacterium]